MAVTVESAAPVADESRCERFKDGRRNNFVSSKIGAERGESDAPLAFAWELVGTSSEGRREFLVSGGRAGGVSGL